MCEFQDEFARWNYTGLPITSTWHGMNKRFAIGQFAKEPKLISSCILPKHISRHICKINNFIQWLFIQIFVITYSIISIYLNLWLHDIGVQTAPQTRDELYSIKERFGFTLWHRSDVIMSTMASQITGVSIGYSTVCSGGAQRKQQSSALLTLVREFIGDRWIPHLKGQ